MLVFRRNGQWGRQLSDKAAVEPWGQKKNHMGTSFDWRSLCGAIRDDNTPTSVQWCLALPLGAAACTYTIKSRSLSAKTGTSNSMQCKLFVSDAWAYCSQYDGDHFGHVLGPWMDVNSE